MKRIRKIFIGIISTVLFLFLLPNRIYAESGNDDYGSDEIISALPNDVAKKLGENNLTPENGGVLSISPQNALSYIWETFISEITKPLKMFFSVAGIILLSALLESLRDSTGSGNTARTVQLIGVICCAGMICTNIAECVERTADTLSAAGSFFGVFIPIFAGIMAVTGQIATATVFCSVIIIAGQIITQLILIFLIPLSSCILGVSVAGAVNPDLKIENIAQFIKKIVIWVLGILVTIFVGLLSVQGVVAGAADSVTLRAAKFAVSNSVPIIGGAVSDALATVKSSVGLVRGSTGTFGIIAVIALVLPSLMSIVGYRLALMLLTSISEMFGTDTMTKLIKSGENVMAIILAMLMSFVVLMVVSVAIMLFMYNGGVG